MSSIRNKIITIANAGYINGESSYILKHAGTDIITINGDGVGIGTTPNSSYKLNVGGDINIPLGSNFKINGVNFSTTQWTTNQSNIYYNTGNVGIGSTNPATKLDVIGTGRFSSTITSAGATITGTTNITGTTTINNSGSSNITIGGSSNTGKINIGIGTSSTQTIGIGTAGSGVISIGSGGSRNILLGGDGIGKIFIGDSGTGDISLGATSRPIIINSSSCNFSSGNVGIGTTNPITRLHVDSGNIYAPGTIVQIQSYTYNGNATTNDSTWKQIDTNYKIAITPKSINSKILIQGMLHIGGDESTDARFTLIRLNRNLNSSNTYIGNGTNANTSSIGTECIAAANWGGGVNGTTSFDIQVANVFINYIDTPSTTNEITYSFYWNSNPGGSGSRKAWMNRTDDHNDGFRANTISTITVYEIGG